MNTREIEERVRAATRAAADTVAPDSVPPLRLAPDRSFRSRLRASARASTWTRWLAPTAAAVAVVAVAVTMVMVGRTVDARPGVTGPGPSSRPGPVKPGPPVSSYVASGRVPRYYLSIESQGSPVSNPSYVVVRATATGTEVETYTPAYGNTVMAVTAAADDRTFVLDEQPWVSNPNQANQNFEPRSFFLLRLDRSGMIVSVTRLAVSVPRGQLMTGFALSPDGRRLAIAVQPDNNKKEPDLTEVKVITLATGATATWTANGTIGTGPDDARSLSWADDERTLAFTWAVDTPGVHTGIWLLDLATGGGSLLADSREAVSLINQGGPGTATAPSTSASASVSASLVAPSTANSSDAVQSTPSVSGAATGNITPVATSTLQVVTPPECQLDSIITPDGSAIACGAIGATGTLARRGAETEFTEYSTATGQVARVLGYWTFGRVSELSVDLLWSNASGSVLIGVIPGGENGQVGVISGNEFTPLPLPGAAAAAFESGTW
jgi:hypothetical protein